MFDADAKDGEVHLAQLQERTVEEETAQKKEMKEAKKAAKVEAATQAEREARGRLDAVRQEHAAAMNSAKDGGAGGDEGGTAAARKEREREIERLRHEHDIAMEAVDIVTEGGGEDSGEDGGDGGDEDEGEAQHSNASTPEKGFLNFLAVDEESVGEGDEEFETMEDDEGEGGNEEEDDDEEDDFAEDLLEQLGDKQSAKSTAATHGAEGMFGQGGQKQRGDIKKVIEDAAQLQALRQDLADRKNDGKVDSAGSAGKKKKAAKIMVVKKKVRIM